MKCTLGNVLSILTFIAFIVLQSGLARAISFSCAENVHGFSYNLDRISGTWYEAARIPASVVPACVSVEAPDNVDNGTYNLRLNYMNNVNKQWTNTTEHMVFPWNNDTQKGIFEVVYGSGSVTITFIFKLMFTDYDHVAAVCYYTTFAPSLSMLKVLTRNREVNATLVNEVQKQADKYGYGSQVTWVEQSARCSATTMTPTLTSLGTLILVFISVQKIWNKVE